jgi:hypothetical protein
MEDREKPETRKNHKRFNVKMIALAAAALIAVFLLGYIPANESARNARKRIDRLEHDLRLADLRGQLGMASYEANRNNYANGAQHSTAFFNGLRETINNTDDQTLKQNLERIIARRDEITSNLAEADPAVKEKLARAYADLFRITAAQQSREQR